MFITLFFCPGNRTLKTYSAETKATINCTLKLVHKIIKPRMKHQSIFWLGALKIIHALMLTND